MTQSDDLIVGKSVEEIEGESGNRVNSSRPGEDHRDVVDTTLIPTASGPLGGGQAGTALAGLPGLFGTEVRGEDGRDLDTVRDADRDSSEE